MEIIITIFGTLLLISIALGIAYIVRQNKVNRDIYASIILISKNQERQDATIGEMLSKPLMINKDGDIE